MSLQPRDNQPFLRKWRGLLIIGAIIAAAIGLALLLRKLMNNRSNTSGRQNGFTLLETLVAVGIISVIGITLARALDTNARAGIVLDENIQAANLITSYMENIRELDYDDGSNPYAGVSANISLPPQYNVVMEFAYSGDGVSWSSTNNSGAYKLQRIKVSVSRTSGISILSASTFRTPR